MKKLKTTGALYYFASVCFYLAGIMTFINKDNSNMGVTWICLGSAMLCFGTVYTNKSKKNK